MDEGPVGGQSPQFQLVVQSRKRKCQDLKLLQDSLPLAKRGDLRTKHCHLSVGEGSQQPQAVRHQGRLCMFSACCNSHPFRLVVRKSIHHEDPQRRAGRRCKGQVQGCAAGDDEIHKVQLAQGRAGRQQPVQVVVHAG